MAVAKVRTADATAYFREARSFDHDRTRFKNHALRISWIAAGTLAVVAIAEAVALAGLTPLKTVEPIIVRVNDVTGQVDVANVLADKQAVTANEAVSKFFLAAYVRQREGYAIGEREANFRAVTLMSTPAEQARFAEYYRAGNPDSPQNLYGRSGTIDPEVTNIGFIGEDIATVRFTTAETRGTATSKHYWIATVRFFYATAPMSERDRYVNPLGIQVADYRRDPEVVP